MEELPAYSDKAAEMPEVETTPEAQQTGESKATAKDGRKAKVEFPIKLYMTRNFHGTGKHNTKAPVEKTDVLLLSTETTYQDLLDTINQRCQQLFDLPVEVGVSATALNLTTGTEGKRKGDVVTFSEHNCKAVLTLLKRQEKLGQQPTLWFIFYYTPPDEKKAQVLKKAVSEKEMEKAGETKGSWSSKGFGGLFKRWSS